MKLLSLSSSSKFHHHHGWYKCPKKYNEYQTLIILTVFSYYTLHYFLPKRLPSIFYFYTYYYIFLLSTLNAFYSSFRHFPSFCFSLLQILFPFFLRFLLLPILIVINYSFVHSSLLSLLFLPFTVFGYHLPTSLIQSAYLLMFHIHPGLI